MKKLCVGLFLSLQSLFCLADHLRGGEITIQKVAGNEYKITLKGYARYASPVKMGGGTLNFGDGTSIASPNSGGNYLPTADDDVGIYIFNVNHVYSGPGFYKVSYTEQNFENGIINVPNSISIPMYLESGFVIDSFLNYSPPQFSLDPIFSFDQDSFSFSSGPTVRSDYTYKYELAVPTHNFNDYIDPGNLQVDSQTGLMAWDTKFNGTYRAGQYLFAVKVNQFDHDKNYLGYVIRVFTVNLYDSEHIFSITNPVNDAQGRVRILQGDQMTIKIIISEPNTANTVQWDVFYDSALLYNNLSFTQYDSTTASNKIKVGLLHFSSTNSIVRDLPYFVTLRASSSFQKDIVYSIFTTNIEWPVITAINSAEKQIQAYPNPFVNELNIAGATAGSSVEIFDQLGQRVQQSAVDIEGKIDTSRLPNGMYIVAVAEGNSRFKVIKK